METTCLPAWQSVGVAQWKAIELVTHTSRSRFITRRDQLPRFTWLVTMIRRFWSRIELGRTFPSSRILAFPSFWHSFFPPRSSSRFYATWILNRRRRGSSNICHRGILSITDYREASMGKLDNDKIDYGGEEAENMRGILWPTWIKKLWEFYWACALDDGWIARIEWQYCVGSMRRN